MKSLSRLFALILTAGFAVGNSNAWAAGGPFGGYYGEVNLVNDAISFYVVNREVKEFGADVIMLCNDLGSGEPEFERIFSVHRDDFDGRPLPSIRINRTTGKATATFTYRDTGFRLGTVTVKFKLKKNGRSKVRFEVTTTPEEGSQESCSAVVNFVAVVRNPNLLPSDE